MHIVKTVNLIHKYYKMLKMLKIAEQLQQKPVVLNEGILHMRFLVNFISEVNCYYFQHYWSCFQNILDFRIHTECKYLCLSSSDDNKRNTMAQDFVELCCTKSRTVQINLNTIRDFSS